MFPSVRMITFKSHNEIQQEEMQDALSYDNPKQQLSLVNVTP